MVERSSTKCLPHRRVAGWTRTQWSKRVPRQANSHSRRTRGHNRAATGRIESLHPRARTCCAAHSGGDHERFRLATARSVAGAGIALRGRSRARPLAAFGSGDDRCDRYRRTDRCGTHRSDRSAFQSDPVDPRRRRRQSHQSNGQDHHRRDRASVRLYFPRPVDSRVAAQAVRTAAGADPQGGATRPHVFFGQETRRAEAPRSSRGSCHWRDERRRLSRGVRAGRGRRDRRSLPRLQGRRRHFQWCRREVAGIHRRRGAQGGRAAR